ncbi:speriolin-like [Bufo bufo]|uniref:speriolin-like n=1 Tax=Bufo bufo TaxID=8384 RepID=UPI001ABE18EF|nr:speriolin-like [Bufo bufo]
MSSAASEKNIMDKTVDIPKADLDSVSVESERLLIENAKLRKLMGLMQENVELRDTLRDHERKIRNLSPPRKSKKESKEKDMRVLETRSHQNKDLKLPGTNPDPNTKCEATTDPRLNYLDPEKLKQCKRMVGEIAFQLDRRILCAIFHEQQRLYGYRVANIKEKITQVTTCPLTGKVDDQLRSELSERYHQTMDQLKKLGYDPTVHPYYAEYLVNTYGIIKERLMAGNEDMLSVNDPQVLSKIIAEYMVNEKVEDILIILKCLAFLATQNGSTMFIW